MDGVYVCCIFSEVCHLRMGGSGGWDGYGSRVVEANWDERPENFIIIEDIGR